MNQINAVSKTWFAHKEDAHVDDYDTLWNYGDLQFGVMFTKKDIFIDVFSSKRWKRDLGRREKVGYFAFAKSYFGWTPEIAQLHKSYQGNGVGRAIYLTLARSGFPVQSGSSMSQGALKMWAKLCNECEVMTRIKGNWYQVEDVVDPMDLLEENKLVLWG